MPSHDFASVEPTSQRSQIHLIVALAYFTSTTSFRFHFKPVFTIGARICSLFQDSKLIGRDIDELETSLSVGLLTTKSSCH